MHSILKQLTSKPKTQTTEKTAEFIDSVKLVATYEHKEKAISIPGVKFHVEKKIIPSEEKSLNCTFEFKVKATIPAQDGRPEKTYLVYETEKQGIKFPEQFSDLLSKVCEAREWDCRVSAGLSTVYLPDQKHMVMLLSFSEDHIESRPAKLFWEKRLKSPSSDFIDVQYAQRQLDELKQSEHLNEIWYDETQIQHVVLLVYNIQTGIPFIMNLGEYKLQFSSCGICNRFPEPRNFYFLERDAKDEISIKIGLNEDSNKLIILRKKPGVQYVLENGEEVHKFHSSIIEISSQGLKKILEHPDQIEHIHSCLESPCKQYLAVVYSDRVNLYLQNPNTSAQYFKVSYFSCRQKNGKSFCAFIPGGLIYNINHYIEILDFYPSNKDRVPNLHFCLPTTSFDQIYFDQQEGHIVVVKEKIVNRYSIASVETFKNQMAPLIGSVLADSLPTFSLDVVNIVAGYVNPWGLFASHNKRMLLLAQAQQKKPTSVSSMSASI